jgi:protein phosphatase PTC7
MAFPPARHVEPLLPPASVTLTRPMTLRTGAAAVPHPDKMKAGARGVSRAEAGHAGEDAYFVAVTTSTATAGAASVGGGAQGPGALVLGVADGVYAWRDKGIDAGAFSRGLCAAGAQEAVALVAAGTTDLSPLRLLQGAYRAVMTAGLQGSCTACFVVVDPAQGTVRSANVGDSGYLLMSPRRQASGSSAAPSSSGAAAAAGASPGSEAIWQPGGVKYRSPQQEHEFGRPYQLGHHANSDAPEDAMLHAARLCPGDVMLMGSDGLWDNLHDSEIASAVQAGVDAGHSPGAIARAVAAAAYERSTAKRASTPYSLAASEAHDLVYSGGKRDDIAVVVLLAEAAA